MMCQLVSVAKSKGILTTKSVDVVSAASDGEIHGQHAVKTIVLRNLHGALVTVAGKFDQVGGTVFRTQETNPAKSFLTRIRSCTFPVPYHIYHMALPSSLLPSSGD